MTLITQLTDTVGMSLVDRKYDSMTAYETHL